MGVSWRSSKSLLPQGEINNIKKWEDYLNAPGLKTRLVARYIYENLFLANTYFQKPQPSQPTQFYKLVRSSTPPGKPIAVIATHRPFDDPGVSRMYYRLRPIFDTVLFKTNMPYLLDGSRMEKFNKWFFQDNYNVTSFPSYEPRETANPIITFADIPANNRYEFMLEEARFTIVDFIKGAVCQGQTALNVINDHFWVVFAQPVIESAEHYDSPLRKELIEDSYD